MPCYGRGGIYMNVKQIVFTEKNKAELLTVEANEQI